MDDKNSASGDTVKMEADDGKPNHVEDKENAMDGSTTNVIFFPSFLLQNYKGELFIKKIYFLTIRELNWRTTTMLGLRRLFHTRLKICQV